MMFPVFFMSLITFPLFLIFYCLMWLTKAMVFMYVKKKYGNRVKHLRNADILFTVGQICDNMVNIVVILNLENKNDGIYEEVKEEINEKVVGNPEKYIKLLCTYHTTFGYPYLLRDKVTVEDIVHVIDVENSTYESVEDIVADYDKKPTPMNNKLLWQILIIQASEEWKNRNNLASNHVPIIYRMSHILGDGMALLNFGLSMFGKEERMYNHKILNTNEKKNNNRVLKFLENVFLFFLTPGALTMDYLALKMKVEKAFVSNNSYVTFKVEKEDDCILERIKRMKASMGDITVTEVLLLGISASFHNYHQKKKNRMGPSMRMMVMRLVPSGTLSENGVPQLKNTLSYVNSKVPLSMESKSLLDRLKAIKMNTKTMKNGFELSMRKFISNNVATMFPILVIEKWKVFKNICGYLTNLPEVPKMIMLNRCEVEHLYFTSIQRDQMIHGINVLTYNGKLHIGMKNDKNAIDSKEDCEELLDNIFSNIKLLEQEMERKNFGDTNKTKAA